MQDNPEESDAEDPHAEGAYSLFSGARVSIFVSLNNARLRRP